MNQKIENLLNISLQATRKEREKSVLLEEGYDNTSRRWEIIVKTSGDISYISEKYPDTETIELLGGYAVIRTNEKYVEFIAGEEIIDYVEKPKRLYYELETGKLSSCIFPIPGSKKTSLSGKDVIVAIIDSGIDIFNKSFLDESGKTRIKWGWDQNTEKYYSDTMINEYINTQTKNIDAPLYDVSGHGTNVALIAAGSDGVAYDSDIIAVKLGRSNSGFGSQRTTELMLAIDYVIRKSFEIKKPIVINLSIGNTYGSHDGSSLLETYIDNISLIGRNCICVGSGNEANNGNHSFVTLNSNEEIIIQLQVGGLQPAIDIQIWKFYSDDFEVELYNPSGEFAGKFYGSNELRRFFSRNTQILTFKGQPSFYSIYEELFIELLPINNYIDSGVWSIVIKAADITNGAVNLWLPPSNVLSEDTRFLISSPGLTQTIPSTAKSVITVGAYNDRNNSYAPFSGRGYMGGLYGNKPDLVAPGVNVVVENRLLSGTSFSTPFVSGACACLMEWGITNNNDPYLYGQKIKAYLRRGARKLPGYTVWPNDVLGYGALCLNDSIPKEILG